MLTGKDKALLLLNVLGDQSQVLLSKLPAASARFITASIDDAPEPSQNEMVSFLKGTLTDIDKEKQLRLKITEPTSFMSDLDESDSGSSFVDLEDEETPEVEERQKDPTLRTPSKIAGLLAQQKPQIVAFFLSRLEDPLKSDILRVLPEDVMSDADARSVEDLPISDRVFEKLYEQICKKQPHEDSLEEEEDEIELGFSL